MDHEIIFITSGPGVQQKVTCAPIKGPEQTVHPYSLIRVFNGRSLGSQGPNVSLSEVSLDGESSLYAQLKPDQITKGG